MSTTYNIFITVNVTYTATSFNAIRHIRRAVRNHRLVLTADQRALLQQFRGLYEREESLHAESLYKELVESDTVNAAIVKLQEADEDYKSIMNTVLNPDAILQALENGTLEQKLDLYKAVVEAKQELFDLMPYA
jgi:hypothetical protein